MSDPWFLVVVSVGSVVGFVFFTTAIVAQFGDIARYPRWSRACVLPRAATMGGRVLNSLTYAVMAPLSPLLAVAVVADALRLQHPALVLVGLVALVAIAAWLVFLFRSNVRSNRDRMSPSSPGAGV